MTHGNPGQVGTVVKTTTGTGVRVEDRRSQGHLTFTRLCGAEAEGLAVENSDPGLYCFPVYGPRQGHVVFCKMGTTESIWPSSFFVLTGFRVEPSGPQ